MTPEEKLDVDEMQKVFDIVTKTLALREAEIARLKPLLARAADALESNQIATSTSCAVFTLIDELRKAAAE